jgi:hypothetical protein
VSFLLRFEAACAALVESAFARVFPSELEPRHVARKLVATMESAPTDTYLVHVHPRDFARLGPHRAALERQWSALLTGLSERLDLQVGSVVRVVLQDDPTIVAGSVGVEAIVDADAGRPLALRVESAPAGVATYVVRDTLSIGRAPDNDIVVADPSVSRYHAKVRAITGGVEIEDCGSSNGLVVDGARVARATLVPQESVQLGDARVTVERQA